MDYRRTDNFLYWLAAIACILCSATSHAANDYIVAPSGGDITGAALSARLANGNVTLQSSQGKSVGAGNVIINDVVTWTANTTLTLNASNNVTINANLSATGNTAGLVISPNTANGNEQPVGSGSYNLNAPAITLSGATPTLMISGTGYTVINTLGIAADAATAPAVPTLQGMAAAAGLSGNYALGSDIDASATSGWNNGQGFTPIGTSANPFMGTFEGLGHTVGNFTINLPTAYITPATNNNIGLFGVVGNGMRNKGIIRNIGVSGGSVSGNLSVGGLVGYNNGTIINSFTAVNVRGGGYDIGGLTGNNSGSISYSYAMGDVTATLVQSNGMSSSFIGGLAGESYGAINNSYATGNVIASGNNVGGLIGSAKDYTSISSCYATGNIQGSNSVGGLVGEMHTANQYSAATVAQSYALGNVTGSINTGGLVGIMYTDNGSGGNTITSSYSAGNVNCSGSHVGGLVGYAEPGSTVSTSYWDVTASGQSASSGGTGLVSQQMKTVSALNGFGFANAPGQTGWVIVDTDNSLNNAGGAAGATYPLLAAEYSTVIRNAHQFKLRIMSPDAHYLYDVAPAARMKTVSSYAGLNMVFTTTPGASGWVILDQDGTLNNANGAPGATLPLPASEYSTTITTALQLQLMAMAPAANYTLGNTIDASATGNCAYAWDCEGFAPVGGSTVPFSGTFDGQGRIIANLAIIRPASSNVGLFGVTAASASIKNLGLTGGTVSGNVNVGGLAGYLNGSTLSTSSFSGSVTGSGNAVGGLTGANTGNISLSYAKGNVSGAASDVGGLVGNNGTNATILNCYATSKVSGGPVNVGGLAGGNYQGATINSSYAAGSVSGTGNTVGGLVGGNQGTVSNSYWDIKNSGQTASAGGFGLDNSDMFVALKFQGFDFKTPVWVIVDNDGTLNNADGADGATYPLLAAEYATSITNPHQLQLMAMNPAATYRLNADVDATGTSGTGDIWGSAGFAPVGGYSVPFSGNFDGQGHTISNLAISQRKLNRVGLFGIVGSGATIQNTMLAGGTVQGYSGSIGGLTGINYGTVSNCRTSNTANGTGGFIGGMIGSNNGTVGNSQASGTVSGTGGFRGGLAGTNNGTISNCSATGAVTGQGGYTGQLVGYNNGTIK